jgi:hypothetical protein
MTSSASHVRSCAWRASSPKPDTAPAARLVGFVDAVYERFGSVRDLPSVKTTSGYSNSCASLPEANIASFVALGKTMDRDAASAEAPAIPNPKEAFTI